MAKNKARRRSSLTFGEKLIFIAGILLCLVLITTAMMGGLFARYVATGTGSDSARVVRFGDLTLTETGDFDGAATKKAIIIPGVDLNKKVTVSFDDSEVATIVFVEVSAPGWTSDDYKKFWRGTQMSWSIAAGWNHLGGTEYIYYRELAPNTPLVDVDIIHNGTIDVASSIKESDLQNLGELGLSFRASVIQNDGSLTPQTAWDRLK